jgi:hypothetical protein
MNGLFLWISVERRLILLDYLGTLLMGKKVLRMIMGRETPKKFVNDLERLADLLTPAEARLLAWRIVAGPMGGALLIFFSLATGVCCSL